MTLVQVLTSIFIAMMVGGIIGGYFALKRRAKDVTKAKERIDKQKQTHILDGKPYDFQKEIAKNNTLESEDSSKEESKKEEENINKGGSDKSPASSSEFQRLYKEKNKELTESWEKKKQEWRDKRKAKKEKRKLAKLKEKENGKEEENKNKN